MIVGHVVMGAVAYTVLSQLVGVEPGVTAPLVGGFMGAAPDLVDKPGAALGLWPRGWMRAVLHHNRLALLIQLILVAPGLHVISDLLAHSPALPEPGDSADFDEVLFSVFGKNIARRDLYWLMGEFLTISVSLNVLQLAL